MRATALSLEATKMSIGAFSPDCSSSCSSSVFPSSEPAKRRLCSTLEAVAFLLPTVSRTGSFRKLLAKFSTVSGIVAEKMLVHCRERQTLVSAVTKVVIVFLFT